MLYACINRWKYTGFMHGYASMTAEVEENVMLREYLRSIGANYLRTMTEEEYARHTATMTADLFVPLPPHTGLCIKVL